MNGTYSKVILSEKQYWSSCFGVKIVEFLVEHKRLTKIGVKIKTVTCSSKDAVGIVDFAIRKMVRGEFSTEGKDEVVCVFDCDENEDDDLAKAFKNARENKIKMCLSNPFFELWFLLHYEYTDQPFTKEKLESRLEKHISNYVKNKDYYSELLSKRDHAIKNADKLNRHHLSDNVSLESVKSNPSTQVHEVIALIRGFNSQK